MFRGGAAVAVPTTRPPGRLNLLSHQSGVLQQTAGVSPSWQTSVRGADRPQHLPPTPTNCELKQKWRAGLTHRSLRTPQEPTKPEGQSLPQWKRKQEEEKKAETNEKNVQPLWKRIREAEQKQESERKQEGEKTEKNEKPQELKMDTVRTRTEPLWKKKQEPVRQETKLELEKKPDVETKGKAELKRIQESKNKPEEKPKSPNKTDVQKIEPVQKLEPLWKRRFEPVKKTEPEVNEVPVKKTEPIWKRKTQLLDKKDPETKQEPVKQTEPKFPVKLEPIWKRKMEPEEKQGPKSTQEPAKKPEPLWKRKKEPEKQSEQKPESTKTAIPDDTSKTKQEEDENLSEENDAEEILCPMCSELYDEEEQQPVLLPRCGHTFCRSCLNTIKGKGHFACPTCRKRHLKPPIEDLPINTEMLSRADAYRETKAGTCQTHHVLLEYWCRDCQAPLCSVCRVTNGHDVVRTKVVLQEKRCEMKEKGQAIFSTVLKEKKKILDSVRDCSAQILKACEESVAVDCSSQDVKEMLSDKKQTADLNFVLRSLGRMKSILGFFGRFSSDSEKDDNAKSKSRRRKDHQASERSVDDGNREGDSGDERKMTPNTAENKTDLSTKQLRQITRSKKRGNQQQTTTGGEAGTVPPEIMRQGPLLSLTDASVWPLTCCVYAENGRRAQLSRQGGRLHMSALTDDTLEAHFMIKLSVIQSVIPQDHPEVFLEVEAGERRLDRIYIKLWGHLRRAHHFLALCMGTHGPSYRGAKFEEVFSRGLRGECLHAGPYLTPSGDLSAQRVMDTLEWDGEYKMTQQKGMVVGAGSGRPDRESCFDICTIENPTRSFACPFGEVVGGWDTVMAIIDYRPVRAVTMVDVGVVLPDGVLSSV